MANAKLITAKFNSTCPRCGRYINAGSPVYWQPGAKAWHQTCPERGMTLMEAARAPRRATPVPRRPAVVKQEGWVWISRPSDDRYDNYHEGQLVNLRGDLMVVSAVLAKSQDPDDDSWVCNAYARPATEAERAPVEAERARKAERAASLTALRNAVQTVESHQWDPTPLPGERLEPNRGGLSVEWYVRTPDGAIAYYASRYDDGFHGWVTCSPDASLAFERARLAWS